MFMIECGANNLGVGIRAALRYQHVQILDFLMKKSNNLRILKIF